MSKGRILAIVLATITLICLFPLALELLFTRGGFSSALTQGEWAGFLGSYVGGALGGVGTLLAVYITTRETRKVQQETAAQTRQRQEKEEKLERKRFSDALASDIAAYIAAISNFFYDNRTFARLEQEREPLVRELRRLQQELRTHSPEPRQGEAEIGVAESVLASQRLSQQRDELVFRIQQLEKDMDPHRTNRALAVQYYFLLQMKLKGIPAGQALLSQLDQVHKSSTDPEETAENFNAQTEQLLTLTVAFIDRYVEQAGITQ